MERRAKHVALLGFVCLALAGFLFTGCPSEPAADRLPAPDSIPVEPPVIHPPEPPPDDSPEPPADDSPEPSITLPPVSFEIQEWEAINEMDAQYHSPRAYLAVRFSSDTDVSLTLTDPDGRETDSQLVTRRVTEAKLPMTPSSLETPAPGTYTVTVHRWSGELVTTLEVGDFIGANLTVSDVRFVGRGDIITDTVRVDVANNGDLPAYIKNAEIRIGGVRVSVSGDYSVILPDESAALYYQWYSGSGSPDTPAVELALKDNGDNVVATCTTHITLAPWEHYIDWTLGYAVRYPANWTMTDDSSSVEVFMTIESPGGETEITIRSYPAAGAQLDQWADGRIANRQAEWFYHEVLEDEETTWLGLPARRIVWEGKPGISDEVTQRIELCFKQGDMIYSVYVLSAPSFYSDLADRIDAIVDSFELLK